MSELILIRHGQSLWNLKNVFTGWVDVPLSEKGIDEALKAGEKLKDYKFDAIYVSTLVRAVETAMIVMAKNVEGKVPVMQHTATGDNDLKQQAEWSKIYSDDAIADSIPVYSNWRLNERYYGELQGLNKKKTAQKYGDEQVHIWRRSYDVPPPAGEALKHTAERTIPFFNEKIVPHLKDGENILISAHGNSLRSIVMELDNLSEEEVLSLEIKTGDPLRYVYTDGEIKRAEFS